MPSWFALQDSQLRKTGRFADLLASLQDVLTMFLRHALSDATCLGSDSCFVFPCPDSHLAFNCLVCLASDTFIRAIVLNGFHLTSPLFIAALETVASSIVSGITGLQS